MKTSDLFLKLFGWLSISLVLAYLIDNVLNIETTDNQVLIVSLHEPTSQIWYSSPLSGALHFRFEGKKSTWVNTRNDTQEFPKIVLDEIKIIEK